MQGGSVGESGTLLWTVEELARELRCSPRSARRLCQARRVPGARRIGSRWFVHPDQFREGFAAPARPLPRLSTVPLRRDALDRAWRAS